MIPDCDRQTVRRSVRQNLS